MSDSPDPRRRALLKLVVIGSGAGVAGIAGVPAVPYLLFPLRERVVAGADELVTVGRRGQFSGGEPVRVDVRADMVDAWNRSENVRLGSAWIVERDGGLVAFSTVCPHLGCSVDFDPQAGKFKCPCHRSAFSLDGAREEGPSPRDLDRLELREEAGQVALRYVRFRPGVPGQEPV